MKRPKRIGRSQKPAGAALLIAIFALLLISVVGIALLVSTSADTALAGNYRTSTAAYYAALAGLEEARGRLLWKNSAYIGNTVLNFVPTPGGPPLDVHTVLYIVNPNTAIGETVIPTDPSNAYADKEYDLEFYWRLSGANVLAQIPSVSPVPSASPALPGPAYKWVRINPVTEQALGINVAGAPGNDPNTALYYDGTGLNKTSTGSQALEITALAVMPSGSTKLLQYVVAPSYLNLYFPSALTLDGNGVSYVGPDASQFYLNGNDRSSLVTCSSPPVTAVPAIGYTNPSDSAGVSGGTNSFPGNYQGSGFIPAPPPPPIPSLGVVTTPSTLQKPSQLNLLVQNISQNADVVIPGNANRGNLAAIATMSAANPLTVVVNGDLDLTTGSSVRVTGFGLLLVTGTFTYDPGVSWNGLVLVIGKGTFVGSGNGTGVIDGAMLVAQTRDPVTGNPLPDPNLGASSVVFLSGSDGGKGIYYNTCWIQMAQSPTTFARLSFREINLQ
jgi:Tfp pilus assembly protein PilX